MKRFSKTSKCEQPPLGNRNQLGGILENSKLRKPKVKRGGKKYKNQSLVLFSANAEGLKPKIESLKNELNDLNVAVFTIQETHHTKKGMLKLEKYEIFEAIRKKQDGGTLIGVNKSLNPILIKDYDENF